MIITTGIDDVTLRKGYWYILQNPKGYVSELDKIDNRLASYFTSIGVIVYGINSHAKWRYAVPLDGERKAKQEYTLLSLKLIREYSYKSYK